MCALCYRSPGYAVLPQVQRTTADSTNSSARESSGEEASIGQQEPQFTTSGGPAKSSSPQFPHYIFVPFRAPGTNVTFGERSGSDLNIPDSQLEAQEQFLRHQIVVK